MFILLSISCLISSELIVDTAEPLTVSQFACLRNNGFTIFIASIYDPVGEVDENGIKNLVNAKKAGFYTEAYIKPCVSGTCKNNLTSGADQVNDVFKRLDQEFHDIFLWITVDAKEWSSNQQQNQKFVMDMVLTVVNRNTAGGVFANNETWSVAVGNNFTDASSIAQYLWWANWNGKADFTGFTPFGGWAMPWGHEYAGMVTSNNCTLGINLDYSIYMGNF